MPKYDHAKSRLVRAAVADELTGLHQTNRVELERRGLFPQRVLIGKRSYAYVESEILAWIAVRVAVRDAKDDKVRSIDPVINADLTRTAAGGAGG